MNNIYEPTTDNIQIKNVFNNSTKDIDSFQMLEELIKLYPYKAKSILKEVLK